MSIEDGDVMFPFTRESAYDNAPHESGVYVIYNEKSCLYVGESHDLQLRLLEHLADTNGCVMRHMPFNFAFELADAGARVARRNHLVSRFRPICNRALS
jgi:excinuclease UvrABC nuclease subunit